MDVSSILPNGLEPTKQGETRNRLSQDEFFSIMIAELVNQDPLEPMDNNQFLSQVTQLQSLETMSNLTEGIEALLLGQQLSSAGSLIGQSVTGVTAEGDEIEGTVDRVVVNGDEVVLGMGDREVPLSRVQQVRAVAGE